MYSEKSKFVLVDRNNEVTEHYYGITDLARRTMGLIKSGFIGSHFNHVRLGWVHPSTWHEECFTPYIAYNKSKVEWVVYDEHNHPVSVELIRGVKPSQRPDWKYGNWYWKRWYSACWTFRRDPVPSTGKGNGYRFDHGSYRSSVRFANELRQTEGGHGVRAKRRKDIVFLRYDLKWDVYYRSTERDKHSWKKNKKRKQWM